MYKQNIFISRDKFNGIKHFDNYKHKQKFFITSIFILNKLGTEASNELCGKIDFIKDFSNETLYKLKENKKQDVDQSKDPFKVIFKSVIETIIK